MSNNNIEWRDVPGYEGLYKASSDGRIFGVKRGKELKKAFNKKYGRYAVSLGKNGGQRNFNVSRIIAMAFLGERPAGYDLHHKDLDKTNDFSDNLEYLPMSQHRSEHIKQRHPFPKSKYVAKNPKGKHKDRGMYRGVYLQGNKWRAILKTKAGAFCLGSFSTPIEAAKAFDEAAKLHRGDRARLNFPDQ